MYQNGYRHATGLGKKQITRRFAHPHQNWTSSQPMVGKHLQNEFDIFNIHLEMAKPFRLNTTFKSLYCPRELLDRSLEVATCAKYDATEI